MPPNNDPNTQPTTGPGPAPGGASQPPQTASSPLGAAPSPAGSPFEPAAPSPQNPFGASTQPQPSMPSTPGQPFPPATTMAKKSHTALWIAIAIVVVLVAGVGAALWYMGQNQSGNVVNNGVQQSNSDDTKSVKTVSWVAPATMPAKLTKAEQSAGDIKNVYYLDRATMCSITTTTTPLKDQDGKTVTVDEMISLSADAAEQLGVTTTKSEVGTKIKLKDANGKEYTFDASYLTQSVDSPSVSFTSQYNYLYYKQFGTSVALIAYTCPTDKWEANKAELEALVKQFTLVTT